MSLVENVVGIISNKDNKEFEISLYNSLSDISTPKALEIKHKNNTYYAALQNNPPENSKVYIKINEINGTESFVYTVESTAIILTNEKHKMSDFFEDYESKISFANEEIKVRTETLDQCFKNCFTLEEAPMLDTSKVTSMNLMFAGDFTSEGLHTIPKKLKLKTIPLYDTSNVTNMTGMFQNAGSIESIPLLNTSKVTSMDHLFFHSGALLYIADPQYDKTLCQGNPIETVPLLDTSNVESMEGMFGGCYKLKSIPKFNTSKVKDMSYMFLCCTSMNTIPQLDTSNVTNMSSMFAGQDCYALYDRAEYVYNNFTYIPELNTAKVKRMICMFQFNQALTSIDWEIDCSSIEWPDSTYDNDGCAGMFEGCNALSGVIKFKNVPASIAHKFTKEKLGNCGTYTIEIVNTIDR